MRNTLLKMLAALMWALTACADVVPVQNFDLEKVGKMFLKVWLNAVDLVLHTSHLWFLSQMTGKWFTTGFASNAQWFVNQKASMKMGTAMLTPTEGGDINLSYATLK